MEYITLWIPQICCWKPGILQNGRENTIKNIKPQAMFTHCYAHKMNLVLQNASSLVLAINLVLALF